MKNPIKEMKNSIKKSKKRPQDHMRIRRGGSWVSRSLDVQASGRSGSSQLGGYELFSFRIVRNKQL